MSSVRLTALILAVILIGWIDLSAQEVPRLSPSARATVLTILPGEAVYSAFGHTAIRIDDRATGIDVVYNYGTFDFEVDWFYLKFARGTLDYRLSRNRFEEIEYVYDLEQRPILEQRLNLTPAEVQRLFELLEINHLPENRYYRYDILYDNCTTRARNIIEVATRYRVVIGDSLETEHTFRDLIDYGYIEDEPWLHLGIDLLLGATTDQKATVRETTFLPEELLDQLLVAADLDGRFVSVQPDTLFWPVDYQRRAPHRHWPKIVGWGLFAFILTLSIFPDAIEVRKQFLRWFDAVWFALLGLTGLLISFLWFGGDHYVTNANWNILWFLPTHVAAVVPLARIHPPKWLAYYLFATVVLALVIVVGWSMIPQSFNHMTVPILATTVLRALVRGVRISRNARIDT